MSKMLLRNTLRDISKTKARFVSIMLIIMLGVGFLVGINSTAPSMYAVAEDYYRETNLCDFRLISTVGFTEDDVEAVKNTEGVKDVMPSYFTDVLLSGDSGEVVRLFAVPEAYKENDCINKLVLREGRFPESADEIVIGGGGFGDFSIGKKLTFEAPVKGEDLSKNLAYSEFTVVGVVDSPMYISFERGATNVGSGKVSAYMLIPSESFSVERYTELYVTGEDLSDVAPYSEEYENARDILKEKLEATGEKRKEAFSKYQIGFAQASLDEAKLTLENEKARTEKELSDAQVKIDEGRAQFFREIKNAKETLADAKKQIEDGKIQLSEKKQEFELQTKLAEEKIAQGEKDLAKAKEEITLAKAQMKEEIFSAVSGMGISREQFDYLYGDRDMLSVKDVYVLTGIVKGYKGTVDSKIFGLKVLIKEMEERFSLSGKDPESVEEYTKAVSRLAELTAESEKLGVFLDTGKDELLSAVKTLNNADAQIVSSEEELSNAKAELEKGKITAKAEFEKAAQEFVQAEEDYKAGVAELEIKEQETLKELAKSQEELDKSKKHAEREFEKAWKELRKAQKELDNIANPVWYINTRNDNPGYSSYADNVERVNAVGKVFPVFFMLVAVLVCVTTLSRLVEEQRADIGALTTLGYRKKDVYFKYIAYALSATVIGSVVGIAFGVPVIPTVIFTAYKMLYTSMPSLILKLNWSGAVIATLIAMLCTTAVAFFTCNALLKNKPATLLRPKAPKAGKRIFLERLGFVWNKMSFFAKVTARNIFRYKARFFMTVVGVAGCTALIFSAFGLYESINAVMDTQFSEIFTYDLIIAADDSVEYNTDLKEKVFSDKRFDEKALCSQTVITAKNGDKVFDTDTYLAIPESIDDYTKIVNLRNRKTGEQIDFPTDAAVVTEKLAKSLGVAVGDTITVAEGVKEVEFTVSGICENYLYGYVFISPELYEQSFEKEAEFNLFMCTAAENVFFDEDALGKDYLDTEGVLGVSFISASVKNFNDMISSLNYVVLVMIVSAAALAFVVLYNLTNINIAERKREISTLKVLGFKNTETSAYIYRENILLCIFGIAGGLVLGVWLLGYIIATIEMDMVMFGREVHAITFVLSALLTAVFAGFVNVIMHLRLKKIDMVESLKSVE